MAVVAEYKSMKLPELKLKVYEAWEFLSTYRDCVLQPDLFKAEVQGFGDLRRKETWIKAKREI